MKRGRLLVYVFVGLLVVLQYPLWFGSGGVLALWRLNREIAAQQADNARLRERNAALEAEVNDLKQGYDAIEERARTELGMVKKNETFYQIIDILPRAHSEKQH
jgi:cell division protein FtsB